jgi:GNAT superfamily N-acetyltransferase
VTIRLATDADVAALQRLWQAFLAESPPPPYVGHVGDLELGRDDATAWVAEEDGELVGFCRARLRWGAAVEVMDIFVDRAHRGRGIGSGLIDAAVAAWPEATHVRLDSTPAALDFYARLGFTEDSRRLAVDVPTLRGRLAPQQTERSFGSVHVQTDDLSAVERATRQFVPRLPGRSAGTVVSPPRNGWIAVYDELCDREPALLRRLARELSDRMGAVVVLLGLEEGVVVRYALLERGRVVDEYLSVPEFHGPLPPGDVVAMAANPTAVARLTGADAERVRGVARTASSPEQLPPPEELLSDLASALGLAGGAHGYSGAAAIPGAIIIARSG